MPSDWIISESFGLKPGGSGGVGWSRYFAVTAIVAGCSGSSATDAPGMGSLSGPYGSGGQQMFGPAPPTCHDNKLDPGEQCDGPVPQSCADLTMGTRPVGAVQCTNCYIDTNGCLPATQGAGGAPPFGAGGMGGGIGQPPGNGGFPQGNGGAPPGNGGTPPGNGGTPPGNGGTPPTNPNGAPTNLPTATNCPTLRNGATVQIARKNGSTMPVIIYMDANPKSKPDPGGPIINYWHATGSNPAEVHSGFGDANIKKVTDMGGVVAAYTTTACSGCSTTDDLVWFVEDDDVQDTLVACAIQQAKIDTRRIHALGWSAGALHSDHVALARNNYMASVISYSGGALFPVTIPDPNNHVATIQTYGSAGDAVVIDFPTQSKSWYTTYNAKGWYTMMCKHPGGHMIDSGVAPMSFQFFMDHPYEVSPEPYANGIPQGFPAYCGNTVQ
jgi:predicted esterase